MSSYDDYTPQIFYADEEKDGINEAARISDEERLPKEKKRSKGSASSKSTTSKTSKKKKKASDGTSVFDRVMAFIGSRTTAVVSGIILAGFAAYFLISFVSYIGSCLSDQSIIYSHDFGTVPKVSNSGGEGGARLSEFFINGGFGLGAFVIIVWLVCVSLKLLIGKPHFRTLDFTIKCLIGFITLSLIVGLLTIGSNTAINWGGYHGRYVNEWIIGFLGWWGAIILCLVMIALFVVICMRDIIKWALEKKRVIDEKRRTLMEKLAKEREKARLLKEQKESEMELETPEDKMEEQQDLGAEGLSFVSEYSYEETEESYDPYQDDSIYAPEENYEVAEEHSGAEHSDSGSYEVVSNAEEIQENASERVKAESFEGKEDTESYDGERRNSENEVEQPMIVNVNQIAKATIPQGEDYSHRSMYGFPPLELLRESPGKITVDEDEQLENKERIRQTLLEYGVPIVSIEAHVGPTVTLYEIKPDKGNRIAKIKGLVNEIAMSLAAIGVRIIAPIPGRGTIGIEVANKNPQTVWLRSILESKKYQETKASLPLALGSTISNEVFIADLASIPHLLVAGATGKGKSVGLNVIIMSLLFKKRPDELKFVMFDPKMVEFNLYAAIQKQYLAKLPEEEEAIVTDMSKVVPTLNSLCTEMDNRYALLKEAEVRKLEEYNKLVLSGKFKDEPKHKFLPYIVVVVDEFADLMMTAGKEVEIPIARLAQKARAVGIHVIIATQRPAANIITGNIKNNFTGRIAFQVGAGYDSKTILDTFGAEKLIGKGDMLILNNSELTRVQCAFIDTPEVKAICDHISSQAPPADSPYILPEPATPPAGAGVVSGISSSDNDPLYDEIKSYIIMSGEASTSNIQRKYKLGYNRAGRIMDQLEAEGIVGPSQGGKARAVLVSA